jgi:hypothetical protein
MHTDQKKSMRRWLQQIAVKLLHNGRTNLKSDSEIPCFGSYTQAHAVVPISIDGQFKLLYPQVIVQNMLEGGTDFLTKSNGLCSYSS